MTGFVGLPEDFLPFLRELHARQDKTWFAGQKLRYEAVVKAPMRDLVAATNAALARRGVPLAGDPKRSVSRINRDVRFSSDKRIYKDHAAATFTRVPGEMSPGLLYVHIGASEAFAGIGFYAVDPADLTALRSRIAECHEDWLSLEAGLVAAGHPVGSEEALIRMPRGYETLAGSPVADALRRKGQTSKLDLSADNLDAALPDRLADFARTALPLLDFGWAALPR